jgi:CubicO group peptidase (beta-lactamase class C family)
LHLSDQQTIALEMHALHVIDGKGVALHEGECVNLPWWSYTKLVIATSALRLVERRVLELDLRLPDRAYSLRQLLQHESGLPDYGALDDYHSAVLSGEPPWSAEELVSRTIQRFGTSAPGSQWAYSNIGYHYVGEFIASASGTSLAEALHNLVLAPAGLKRARLAQSKLDLADVEMGCARDYDPGWVLHGLLVGPISEAAHLLHRLLTGTLLGEPMLEQMLRMHRLPQFRSELWPEPAYGLGIMGAFGRRSSPFGHSGEGPGSAIAVYGRVSGGNAKVAASWEAPGSSRSAEQRVLEILAAPTSGATGTTVGG